MLGWLFTMLIELDQQNRLKAHKMSSKGETGYPIKWLNIVYIEVHKK